MRAKNFEDIKIGDNILFQMPDERIFRLEIEKIDNDERSIMCKDWDLDFFPNIDDQFIVID